MLIRKAKLQIYLQVFLMFFGC